MDPGLAQRLGDVAVDHAHRQPLDDRGLPDPRLADQDGIVLGPAREDLHHPPDLLVPADHRVHAPLAGLVRQVPREPAKRVVAALRVGAVRRAALAQLRDRRLQARGPRGRPRAGSGRPTRSRARAAAASRRSAVTNRSPAARAVFPACSSSRSVSGCGTRCPAPGPSTTGSAASSPVAGRERRFRGGAGASHDVGGQSVRVGEQLPQHVLRNERLVACRPCPRQRRLHESLAALAQRLKIHHPSPLGRRPAAPGAAPPWAAPFIWGASPGSQRARSTAPRRPAAAGAARGHDRGRRTRRAAARRRSRHPGPDPKADIERPPLDVVHEPVEAGPEVVAVHAVAGRSAARAGPGPSGCGRPRGARPRRRTGRRRRRRSSGPPSSRTRSAAASRPRRSRTSPRSAPSGRSRAAPRRHVAPRLRRSSGVGGEAVGVVAVAEPVHEPLAGGVHVEARQQRRVGAQADVAGRRLEVVVGR